MPFGLQGCDLFGYVGFMITTNVDYAHGSVMSARSWAALLGDAQLWATDHNTFDGTLVVVSRPPKSSADYFVELATGQILIRYQAKLNHQ